LSSFKFAVSAEQSQSQSTPPAAPETAPVAIWAIDRDTCARHDRCMLIFKIFRRPEWDAFRTAGCTDGAPVDRADGFIHFSTAPQLATTAARHFADESDLVLVAVEADRLGAALKWEESRGGALFPHLYRALRIDEVLWDKSLPLGATGHIFPQGVL